MKGFVPTPVETVDAMVDLLFQKRSPTANDTVLDPGCGTGAFIDGIIRWCEQRRLALPQIAGVESDPRHSPALRQKYQRLRAVRIEEADFLTDDRGPYDFIVGNPPYVAITALSEEEKGRYRARYATARGRFDLYLLFFEQALRDLAPGGRLVFITPEKYLYVETAGPLRDMLARRHVEEVRLVAEETFGALVTYPTITAVANDAPSGTKVVRRDGSTMLVGLPRGPLPWLPLIEGAPQRHTGVTLGDVCLRISCGVATGADGVFVRSLDELAPALRSFGRPTLAGRELKPETPALPQGFVMLMPYDEDGRLLPVERMGALGRYLMREDIRPQLLRRTCVKRKPWYAFHETPALRDILRPKILCKDIGETPHFWVDRSGQIVPRHSVYYIVPREPAAIDAITRYLRSPAAHKWFSQNCQRAAKGFLRLQSRVLQRLPLPDDVAQAAGGRAVPAERRRRQTQLAF